MSRRAKSRRGKKARAKSIVRLLPPFLIIACAALVVYFAWSPADTGPSSSTSRATATSTFNKPLEFKAAILDQLEAFSPGSAFVGEAKKTLTSAGFAVKYYPAENVTVELYRRLPLLECRLIVLRVHSAVSDDGGVYPFTSEPYSESKYPFEQLMGTVGKGSLTMDPPYYFAISPSFVTYEMEGNFNGAMVILSTCHGLCSPKLADRLIQRGVSVVIGWDGLVDLPHTDRATLVLLKALVEGATVMQAVETTVGEVGPDPQHGSLLRYYPPKNGKISVWRIPSSGTALIHNRSSMIATVGERLLLKMPRRNL